VATPRADWIVLTTNWVGANGLFTNILPLDVAEALRLYQLWTP